MCRCGGGYACADLHRRCFDVCEISKGKEAMTDKIKRVFYAVFAVCFTFVLINVIFFNEYAKAMPLVLTTAACLAVIAGVCVLTGKLEGQAEKHYKKILVIFAAVMFIAEVALGLLLRYSPMWDVGAVQNGASEWVKTGTFASQYDYYNHFPNNLGGMWFLYVFAKAASLVGVQDQYAVYVFVNSALLVSAMTLVSLICKRLGGIKCAVFALAAFALSPQFYFMGGAVYTDSLSMLFPVLSFWLYLKSKELESKRKIISYIIIGAAVAVGALIKVTVLIGGIAILIDICLERNLKEILKYAVCVTGIVAVVMLSFDGYIYPKHLTRENHNRYARPYIHWVMMGLKGDGRYNGGDYTFTDSFHTLQERTDKDWEETIKRINKLGVGGIFKLISRKSAIDFGDGTYGISDFLNIQPKNKTWLHDWILYDSKNYDTYNTYATSLHIALMLLMLAGAYIMVIDKKADRNKLLVPYLAVFGVWLFLLCWETHRRYFSNYAPMIFICASVTAFRIKAYLVKNNKKTKNLKKIKK